jgi:O-antigen/teichoic acid export membrane protein
VPAPDGDRHETETERQDRNLNELLNELRVALPGVQVLFAFLLVAPFNQGFEKITDFERKLYFATLLCTALASILLIAPSMHHRLLFRRHDKAFVVTTANRLTIVGLSVLALAMTGAVLLVTHVLFGAVTAAVTCAVVVAAFIAVWFVVPVRRRLREPSPRDSRLVD